MNVLGVKNYFRMAGYISNFVCTNISPDTIEVNSQSGLDTYCDMPGCAAKLTSKSYWAWGIVVAMTSFEWFLNAGKNWGFIA